MRRPVKTVAFAALMAALAACGGPSDGQAGDQSGEQPTPDVVTAGPGAPASPASPTVAAVAQPPAFAQCRSCHSVEPGKNRVGPTLHGIVGSRAGEVPGFAFSTPLKQSGITWDRATLDQWLAGPMKMVPGTRMVIGTPDPVRRKEIIDYLETLK